MEILLKQNDTDKEMIEIITEDRGNKMEEMEDRIDLSVRVGDLELRSSYEFKEVFEIVQWFKESKHCYTIAYWSFKEEDGYELGFVGDRPFKEEVNPQVFMFLAEVGQRILDFRTKE